MGSSRRTDTTRVCGPTDTSNRVQSGAGLPGLADFAGRSADPESVRKHILSIVRQLSLCLQAACQEAFALSALPHCVLTQPTARTRTRCAVLCCAPCAAATPPRTLPLCESSREDVVDTINTFVSPPTRYGSAPPAHCLIISYETFRLHAARLAVPGACDLLICDEVCVCLSWHVRQRASWSQAATVCVCVGCVCVCVGGGGRGVKE